MRLVLITVLLLLHTGSGAHDACLKLKCEETKQKIAMIQAKMRQGYSRAQGVRLEAKLKRLRALRSRACR